MKSETRAALAALNRAFYSRFAGDFARTRRTWPPGFDYILPYIEPGFNLLDLGCGNARLLAFLRERGWGGAYVGADASEELLRIAAQSAGQTAAAARALGPAAFVAVDLAKPEWPASLAARLRAEGLPQPDVIASLAVLHHIPGQDMRAQFVAGCAALLPMGGALIISTWQFRLAPRLADRILPWAAAGLADDEVEPGDFLLSWGAGAAGRRYCAAIDREALTGLAAAAGLETATTFYADGHEGNLNLYGVFRRVSATQNVGTGSAH